MTSEQLQLAPAPHTHHQTQPEDFDTISSPKKGSIYYQEAYYRRDEVIQQPEGGRGNVSSMVGGYRVSTHTSLYSMAV